MTKTRGGWSKLDGPDRPPGAGDISRGGLLRLAAFVILVVIVASGLVVMWALKA